jgi:hypothetical protein
MPTSSMNSKIFLRGFNMRATSSQNVWDNSLSIVSTTTTQYELEVKTYPAWQTFYTEYLSFTIVFYWLS